MEEYEISYYHLRAVVIALFERGENFRVLGKTESHEALGEDLQELAGHLDKYVNALSPDDNVCLQTREVISRKERISIGLMELSTLAMDAAAKLIEDVMAKVNCTNPKNLMASIDLLLGTNELLTQASDEKDEICRALDMSVYSNVNLVVNEIQRLQLLVKIGEEIVALDEKKAAKKKKLSPKKSAKKKK